MSETLALSLCVGGLTIVNQTLNRKKIWWCWVGSLVNVVPFTYINWRMGAYGYLVMSAFYTYNAVMGIWEWKIRPTR